MIGRRMPSVKPPRGTGAVPDARVPLVRAGYRS
jgi:hypothetical protein